MTSKKWTKKDEEKYRERQRLIQRLPNLGPREHALLPEEPEDADDELVVEEENDLARARRIVREELLKYEANRLRRWPCMSYDSKLEALGVPEEEILFFLHMIGAFLGRPWCRKRIHPETRTTEDQDWTTPPKGKPAIPDVANLLLGRCNVLALPRHTLVSPAFLVLATTLTLDIDRHDYYQRSTFEGRKQTLAELLPYPVIRFVSSTSGGEHWVFPTEYIDYFWDELVYWGVVPCVDVGGVSEPIINAVYDFNSVVNHLRRIGLDERDVEVWPQESHPLRLPMGPDSYLVTDDGERIEEFRDVVAYLRTFNLTYRPDYPTPAEIVERLSSIPPTRFSWKVEAVERERELDEKWARPRTPKRHGRATSSSPTGGYSEGQEAYETGLTGPGETNRKTLLAAGYILWKDQPGSAEELEELLWEWFVNNENGQSNIMKRGIPAARNQIRHVAQNLWGKFERGVYTVDDPPPRGRTSRSEWTGEVTVYLLVDDAQRLVQMFPPPVRPSYRGDLAWKSATSFALEFARDVKFRVLRNGGDIRAPEHEVEIPSDTIKAMPGAGSDLTKPRGYTNRLDQLRDAGLLVGQSGYEIGDHCRSYRFRFTYAADGDPVEGHATFLDEVLASRPSS